MADQAKKRVRNVLIPLIGDRVSVKRSYFDTDDFKYSESLPETIERLLGKVLVKQPGKAKVTFDIDTDGSYCYVPFTDLVIEDKDLEIQRENDGIDMKIVSTV